MIFSRFVNVGIVHVDVIKLSASIHELSMQCPRLRTNLNFDREYLSNRQAETVFSTTIFSFSIKTITLVH